MVCSTTSVAANPSVNAMPKRCVKRICMMNFYSALGESAAADALTVGSPKLDDKVEKLLLDDCTLAIAGLDAIGGGLPPIPPPADELVPLEPPAEELLPTEDI